MGALRGFASALDGDLDDYDRLLQTIGGAKVVLLGGATWGTHEFLYERARITERLVRELGFSAVALESGWSEAYPANLFVRGEGSPERVRAALSGFRHFPEGCWRNYEFMRFLRWLRDYNDGLPPQHRVGLYGLDPFELRSSMANTLEFLEQLDPGAADRARFRFGCFEDFGEDPHQTHYAPSIRDRSVDHLAGCR